MARALWPHKRKLSEIAYLSRRYPVWCKLASNLSRIKTDTHVMALFGHGSTTHVH
jgi:hypothetical protein